MATVNMLSVTKRYGQSLILNQVDLNIEKGEFVAVVGPSGSGKSTLLRLVAGLDTVTSGDILINEQCVNSIPAAQRNMAMVFQNYALYPHMTVYANMAYGLKMRGLNKNEIMQRVNAVSELLQIKEYLHRKPGALSGGQRQRVAMGRAIVRSPAVFLFDEPLSNLDSTLRTEMRHEIKKLHQQLNTTCLYVTHDQTEAMTLADRVVVLNKGIVEQADTPQMLYHKPQTLFVASFIGHYQMNFIPARVDHRQNLIVTDIGLKMPLPNQYRNLADINEVILGIRPEHIYLGQDKDDSISVKVEFVDDMGSDKLVQVVTELGKLRLNVRITEDCLPSHPVLTLALIQKKAHLFCQKSGKRLGGWGEE